MDPGGPMLFATPAPPPGVERAARIEHLVRARRLREAAAQKRTLEHRARAEFHSRQRVLDLLPPLPRSTAECRGDKGGPVADLIAELGVCPMWSCRYSLALWVKDGGSIKAEVGHVLGGTLKASRRAWPKRVDRIAELVVELGDRLGTLCLWDVVPDGDADALDERRPAMTYEQIAWHMGMTKEQARKLTEEAEHEYDIAAKRLSRAAKREKQAAAEVLAREVEARRRARVAKRDQLVQIRRGPGR